ncbi:predicted protein [Sclerotinia sclerotiorum 1980 UF-70]|uniref:Uncharacterized protein n=1 Tax=Sclerotinia sclerotiorum (strain ATCC 18683 / 1980 / Ss-1) TaxID=665079 RepID=A7EI40_SCLS1|nr:predicted protein [Sclerotinia sclerotiorum 1980 UF-70]EDO02506.1 predicted protein [Sclerotinia sclerotiorum 1980 UF-70]
MDNVGILGIVALILVMIGVASLINISRQKDGPSMAVI